MFSFVPDFGSDFALKQQVLRHMPHLLIRTLTFVRNKDGADRS